MKKSFSCVSNSHCLDTCNHGVLIPFSFLLFGWIYIEFACYMMHVIICNFYEDNRSGIDTLIHSIETFQLQLNYIW